MIPKDQVTFKAFRTLEGFASLLFFELVKAAWKIVLQKPLWTLQSADFCRFPTIPTLKSTG